MEEQEEDDNMSLNHAFSLSDPTNQQRNARAPDDRDSLSVLPLDMMPLESAALRRARLIKNMQLDSVIEVFRDEHTGSGQIHPEQLAQHFRWPSYPPHPDLSVITRLAQLHSYDVYSLRIELRRLNIEVNDVDRLRLSEDKCKELTSYMRSFAEPLIRQVFGDSNMEVQDFDQLIEMFKRPDREMALRNLRKIASNLQIDIGDVPRFLEDYGDIFLSLAYFKECLDRVVPQIQDCQNTIDELMKNFQLRTDTRFVSACRVLEHSFTNIITSITGRFESFEQHTNAMWNNITADSFRRTRDLITAHHTTVGGVLCGLTVKMTLWQEKFGHIHDGRAVLRRGEFIMGEMLQGIEKIEEIESSAPKIAGLS